MDLSTYCCKAADMLHKTLNDYQYEQLNELRISMHEIEHQADLAKHDMMQYLVREFITPVDREDISNLAQLIDTVTDSIEDVLMQLYMFNVLQIRPEALDFSNTIVSCCCAMKETLENFHNYKKPKFLLPPIIEVNNLEEEGDRLYAMAMHDLHAGNDSTLEIMHWTKIYDCLEACCDACEDVADGIESVIMKNS